MPQAIGLLLPASLGATISVAGITLATGAGLTIAGTIVNTLGSLLLNTAVQALFAPDIPGVGPETLKVNVAGEASPRIKHYGRVRTGYAIVFTRATNGTLYRVIVHGHGRFNSIEKYLLDKKEITLDGSGWVQESQYIKNGNNKVQVISRLGVIPETNYGELTLAFPQWTGDHRLDGLASSLLICKLPPMAAFNAMYPNREPTLEVVAQTSRMTDPRDATEKYSDNLALCALDWEISPDGAALAGHVDEASYIQAANDCDEAVALLGGGTEARYRFAGSYDLNEPPHAIRGRFLGACAGENYITPEGKLGLRVGEWYEPRFTITNDMVLGLDWEFGSDAIQSYNVSAFEYVDPDINFTKTSGDPWRDEARITTQGEVTQQPFISSPSHRQCRSVVKIMMERDNPPSELAIRCKPKAIVGLYEPILAVDLAEYGLTGTYRVVKHSVDPRSLVITYFLAEISPDAFSLSLAEQGNKPALAPLDEAAEVIAPTGLTAIGAGGLGGAGIDASWDASTNESWTPRLEYSDAGAGLWQQATVAEGATSANISPLVSSANYDVRLAWQTAGGAVGPYMTLTNVTATT